MDLKFTDELKSEFNLNSLEINNKELVIMAIDVNNKLNPLNPGPMMKPERPSAEKQLREVSNMYEKHFLGEMMKAMRGTVHESGFIQQNNGEKIFREQLDSEYVNKWGEKGGIGLSDLIYKQLVDKFGAQMGITAPVEKPRGPISLDHKALYSAKVTQSEEGKMSYRFDKMLNKSNELSAEDRQLVSPWSGVLLNKLALGDDQFMTDIQHDNGLRTQTVHRGWSSEIKAGDTIHAGDKLGLLSPDANSFFWKVMSDPSKTPSLEEPTRF